MIFSNLRDAGKWTNREKLIDFFISQESFPIELLLPVELLADFHYLLDMNPPDLYLF